MPTAPRSNHHPRSQTLTRLSHPTAGETTLLLVRHGRTEANRLRLMQGVTDVPLDEAGWRQARRIAHRLAQEPSVDAVLSSPLTRALSTAQVIGDALGHEPIVLPALIEMDFGRYEGESYERLVLEDPELAGRFLDLDDYEAAWPGGESRGRFYERVSAAFDTILREYGSHRVVVVAHGGVFGAFLALLQDRSPNDLSVYDLHNCSLTHLHVSPAHTLMHCRNETGHLDPLDRDSSDPLTEEDEVCA